MVQKSISSLAPGLTVLVGGAILAKLIGAYLPGNNHLLLAIVIGFFLANTGSLPSVAKPGIRTHKLWLTTGIVLMGASLTLGHLFETGPTVLLIVLTVAAFTLLTVEGISRIAFNISDELSSLLAAGSSICGVSAIIAVAGSIKAKEHLIAYATGTILLFDGITLLVYPIIGEVLNIPAKVFGIWAGVSMFSTGPVVAVGFAHSAEAGQWATITKLTRNTLIGFVAVIYATNYARKHTNTESRLRLRSLWEGFPKFVLGFLFLMIIASAGLLSEQHVASLTNTYDWLFLLAFIGLGTEIRIGRLRQSGYRPALLVLVSFLIISSLSLILISFILI
ncbi:YeiH family protein [Natrialbaceae archaeon A-chndr2]